MDIPLLTLSTPGMHQRDNASAAIFAARLVNPQLNDTEIRDRLCTLHCTRAQQLMRDGIDVLVDVAHNPASFAALSETLRSEFPGEG